MKTEISRHSLPLREVTQVGTSATLHTDDVKKYVRNLVITAFSTTE